MSEDRELHTQLRESAHRIWLAGLGALAVAGEEGRALFQTLVARGEEYEARGATHVARVKSKVAGARATVGAAVEKAQVELDERVARAMHRLGVPSRDEIAELARRVEDLTRTLERTRRAPRGARAGSEPEP